MRRHRGPGEARERLDDGSNRVAGVHVTGVREWRPVPRLQVRRVLPGRDAVPLFVRPGAVRGAQHAGAVRHDRGRRGGGPDAPGRSARSAAHRASA